MSLKSWAIGRFTGSILKDAAEGKYGPQVKAAYWWLSGHKTQIGVVLAFAAGALEIAQRTGLCAMINADCASISTGLEHVTAGVSAAFVYVGQVDGALHMDAPQSAK
jgi:hypothetical protein